MIKAYITFTELLSCLAKCSPCVACAFVCVCVERGQVELILQYILRWNIHLFIYLFMENSVV